MRLVIEGADKIGKTTQVDLLVKHLDAVKVKLPDEESYSGKILRRILNKELPYEANSFQALMVIDKLLAKNKICRMEQENEYVIMDRWHQSGDVYGVLEGVDESFIKSANELLEPNDLVIILYGEPYGQDEDIYGNKDFQEKVNERYQHLAVENDWVLIDGNQTIEEVHEQILDAIETICTVYKYDGITPNMVHDSIKDCYAQHAADNGFVPRAMFVEASLYNIISTAWVKKNFLTPIISIDSTKGAIIAVGGDKHLTICETVIFLESEDEKIERQMRENCDYQDLDCMLCIKKPCLNKVEE